MTGISQLFEAVGLGLVLLLPLVNPLTSVALLLSLSGNMTRKDISQQSTMAAFYVFLIMMVAFYAGQLVMNTFGISIPGLRIAGGLIVAFIGFRMLFPQKSHIETASADQKVPDVTKKDSENIAFVPLAMPGSAGPGTIAMIISSVSTLKANSLGFEQWVLMVSPVMTFIAVALILLVCLKSAGFIMRLIGKSGIDAVSRLMGFLLVCMGVQFIINGVMELIASY
ncbi:MarC family NAAT transporter [Lonsdalea britannica]|uniref:MarC family NAAT transporter n=1 Tax=Lonsdalea britannica TaxID=1082704 RepID=UPI0026F0C0F7|nr:MarC family NAAT transporter [Lonsdalea britannica]